MRKDVKLIAFFVSIKKSDSPGLVHCIQTYAVKVVALNKMIHSYKSKLLLDDKRSSLSKVPGDFLLFEDDHRNQYINYLIYN